MAQSSGGTFGVAAKKQLRELSERVVSVMTQREALNEDIKVIFNEAKDAGFDTKIMRKAIKRVRTASAELAAEEEMIETYVAAIEDLPLFAAAA